MSEIQIEDRQGQIIVYSEMYIYQNNQREASKKHSTIFGTLNIFSSRNRSKNGGGAAAASSMDGCAAPGAEMATSVFNDAGKNWPR